MPLSPMEVLSSARKAVPAIDYALGVAGIAAAGSIIGTFVGNGKSSAIILGGVLVGMVLLYVFSNLIKSNSPYLQPAGIILLYSTILFFCTFLFFTVTAVAIHWPVPMLKLLSLNEEPTATVSSDIPTDLSHIHDAELRVRKVDDFAWIYVNDNAVVDKAVYSEVGGWIPFLQFYATALIEFVWL